VEPQFWQNRWRNGQIGFHQASVDRSLRKHWARLDLRQGARVFVPLCGKSLDLIWLRDQGHFVTGVELSARALEDFCVENGVPARRRTRGDFELYQAENLELYCGDFFKLTSALVGETAAVYDRAALISWAPDLRPRYADHIAALVRPGSRMLLITLEYPQMQMPGPPFSVPRAEVDRLYSRAFEIVEIARQDILADEARLRSLGVTALDEVCYHLVRR
jgi:thiopurine S-methyltransferase